ncbi:aminotransferase class IV, partial [Patescibacteria group bacterium]|nr:aminotransferase class IV [Patescibacteria group bacterium]
DALFTQNGKLIESTTANIISYINKDTIITPPILEKGLNGITRQILIENLPIKEKAIPSDTTDPIILVNSLNLRIVESIDGRKLKQNSEFVNLIRQTLDKTEKTYITNNNF